MDFNRVGPFYTIRIKTSLRGLDDKLKRSENQETSSAFEDQTQQQYNNLVSQSYPII